VLQYHKLPESHAFRSQFSEQKKGVRADLDGKMPNMKVAVVTGRDILFPEIGTALAKMAQT